MQIVNTQVNKGYQVVDQYVVKSTTKLKVHLGQLKNWDPMEECFFSTYHSSFMVFWCLLVHFGPTLLLQGLLQGWGGVVGGRACPHKGQRLLHFSSTNVGLSCPFHFSETCFLCWMCLNKGVGFILDFLIIYIVPNTI